jgi:hypothetical protein
MGEDGGLPRGTPTVIFRKNLLTLGLPASVSQNSIDLFLGNFIPMNGRLHLWDLEAHDADYYLHNAELTPLLSQIKFLG